ncbi:UDP-glucosyltransferase 29-like [Actinidia eriantha]|uniref:UDP-glucosyltransferase 29-like n=1 Tax=Actinidia eriantha TaxID=165200 RepID=UPI0025837FF9|nr:UDP-glucosyltransferase 29-like [Actinidia eriantha]
MKALMLPWLAYGHISPFLELAKKLTTKNFDIYLCSTPINLNSIKNRITKKYSLSIKLVEINLPILPGLPSHHHTTNGLPNHLIPTLKLAFYMSKDSFAKILDTIKPDLVIYDFNQPWAPTFAAARNIPAVLFMTTGAAACSFGLHMLKKPDVEFPFPGVRLQGFHKYEFQNIVPKASQENENEDKEDALDAMRRSCKIILYNTFRDLEGKYIDSLSILTEKKIVPIGPLVQEPVLDATEETKTIMKWLHNKPNSSTVFVSFGSEYYLSNEEREEVSHGLEISGVNFIWVVRFSLGEKVSFEEALPMGFVERVGERGLVVEGWAPQAQILAHSSTGGFVSHCGWNSVLESLKFGVPVVAMPMHLDQPLNARLVEEVGVGVEVERDENGKINREAIAQVIRKAVVGESGEGVRIKAREFSDRIGMRREEGIGEVVEELVKICEGKLVKN